MEPEECILDTLKGSASKEAGAMIRYNCVRQYIKAVEPTALQVPAAQFTTATAHWFPATNQGYFNSTAERIIITVKNDSGGTIISADVATFEKATKKTQTYRAYVDSPIRPGTVGTLTADVMLGAQDFMKEYTWTFGRVFVVK